MGRKRALGDVDILAVRPTGESKLQNMSDRRAVVQLIIDNGGILSVGDINKHFGFDITPTIRGLMRSGWLEVKE